MDYLANPVHSEPRPSERWIFGGVGAGDQDSLLCQDIIFHRLFQQRMIESPDFKGALSPAVPPSGAGCTSRKPGDARWGGDGYAGFRFSGNGDHSVDVRKVLPDLLKQWC